MRLENLVKDVEYIKEEVKVKINWKKYLLIPLLILSLIIFFCNYSIKSNDSLTVACELVEENSHLDDSMSGFFNKDIQCISGVMKFEIRKHKKSEVLK